MKKLLILCLTMMLWLTASVSFAAKVQWVPIEGEEGLYVDTETATYDAATSSIYFWTKYQEDSELLHMEYYHVKLDTAKECILEGMFYQNLVHPKVTIFPDKPDVDVWPDDVVEKAANIVCDQYGIAHVYPDRANRWTWLYSSKGHSTQYAPDMVKVDKENNTVTIWTQEKLQDSNRTYVTRCICHLADNTIEYTNLKGVWTKEVQPDTLEEKIFAVAKESFAETN